MRQLLSLLQFVKSFRFSSSRVCISCCSRHSWHESLRPYFDFILEGAEMLNMRLPTNIAEILATLAHYVLTAIYLLHQESTIRTSLESTSFYEFFKFLILRSHFHIDLILFTSHSFMPVSSTIHTVIRLTIRTFKMWIIFRHSEEVKLAICSGTARHFFVMFAHIIIETEFVELLQIPFIQ